MHNVRQKVDRRAGQRGLPHVTNNYNNREIGLELKHKTDEQRKPVKGPEP